MSADHPSMQGTRLVGLVGFTQGVPMDWFEYRVERAELEFGRAVADYRAENTFKHRVRVFATGRRLMYERGQLAEAKADAQAQA